MCPSRHNDATGNAANTTRETLCIAKRPAVSRKTFDPDPAQIFDFLAHRKSG